MRLTVVPSKVQNALQKREMNWGPRSETMLVGMPCRRMTCWTSRCAVLDAEESLVRNKVNCFRKMVDNGEDGGVGIGDGEPSNKIQCYV